MAKRKPKVTLSVAHVYVELDGVPLVNATYVEAEGESVGKVLDDVLGQMFLFSDPPPSPASMEASAGRPRKRVASRVVKRIEKQQGG